MILLGLLLGAALAQEPSLDPLAWIEGTWKGDFDGMPFESRYTGTDGGLLLSTSKLYHDGRAVFFEFERFEIRDGAVWLVPYPAGEAAVAFRLAEESTEGRAVFRNPEHDFPREIVYQRMGRRGLEIRLTGVEDGAERESVVRMRRAR